MDQTVCLSSTDSKTPQEATFFARALWCQAPMGWMGEGETTRRGHGEATSRAAPALSGKERRQTENQIIILTTLFNHTPTSLAQRFSVHLFFTLDEDRNDSNKGPVEYEYGNSRSCTKQMVQHYFTLYAFEF